MNHLETLFGLKDKVAIITGGARGIGKCAAMNMAAVGADIVIFDILEDQAKKTAEEITGEHGVRTAVFNCDVRDPAQVKNAISASAEKMGTLDLLFNNAGIVVNTPAVDVTPEEWHEVVNVNLNGVFYMAQAFGKWLIENNKKGSIVNTASMSATIVNIPQPQASYNATKAAVRHLTKSLAVEWVNRGIRVNSISPGYIATELTASIREDYRKSWASQIPMGRMGTPEELVGAIIYLFSDSASYTTGCDIIMDGSFTIV